MMLSAVFFLAIASGHLSDPGHQVQQDQRRHVPERRFQLKDLETITITINDQKFKAWVMNSPAKTQEGMMFLQDSDVKPNEAMIFVFPTEQVLSFWMKNTFIPLDIAYLNSDQLILNTYTMKPHDTYTDYVSAGRALYAVEFKAGTFAKHKIRAGMKATFSKPVIVPPASR